MFLCHGRDSILYEATLVFAGGLLPSLMVLLGIRLTTTCVLRTYTVSFFEIHFFQW